MEDMIYTGIDTELSKKYDKISNIEEIIRIRTGEKDSDAI